jgi:tRNA1Val (adenine37-N6)-methyltransferase
MTTIPEKPVAPFYFKQFVIHQDRCAMKVGTDGVLLGAWAEVQGVNSVLDIGTGTGLIGIMLAQRAAHARIDCVEIDRSAYEQAAENIARSPWAERLQAIHAPVQEYAQQQPRQYDLIVSNPPFFSGGTFSAKGNRVNVRHTVKLPHGDLLSVARDLLAPQGRFSVILPYLEGLRFKELARNYNLYCTKSMEVLPKADKPVERLLLQFERQPRQLAGREERLVIQYDTRNDWTEEYIALTGAFYLKM